MNFLSNRWITLAFGLFVAGLRNRWSTLVLRLFLGGLLIYASFDKIANPEALARIIRNYDAIPYASTNLLALLLPWVELYVGACLFLGIFVDGASLLTMGMMAIFIIALSQAVIRGIDIECGCFKVSAGSSPVGVRRIVEDAIYLAMAYGVWRRKERIGEIYPKSFESGRLES